MGTPYKRGSWCNSLCHSPIVTKQQQILIDLDQPPRNKSLGIRLTINEKNKNKVRSLSSLKPKKTPRLALQPNHKPIPKVVVDITEELPQESKTDLKGYSSQKSTLLKDQSPSLSMKHSVQLDSQSNIIRSSSIKRKRLSSSKDSSKGSLLLIRPDDQDDKQDHLRIRSLFQNNESIKHSVSNVLNSISQETQNQNCNSPHYAELQILFKKYPIIQSIGHTKTSSTGNISHAKNPRTRHSSHGNNIKSIPRPMRLLHL